VTIETAALVAQIIGAAAVVVSLLYLAVQIRDSSKINKATTRSHLTELSENILFKGAEHAEVLHKAYSGEQLTGLEMATVTWFFRAVFRGYENYVYQHHHGFLDEQEWRAFRFVMKDTFARPIAREVWGKVENHYSERLRMVVAAIIAEVDSNVG